MFVLNSACAAAAATPSEAFTRRPGCPRLVLVLDVPYIMVVSQGAKIIPDAAALHACTSRRPSGNYQIAVVALLIIVVHRHLLGVPQLFNNLFLFSRRFFRSTLFWCIFSAIFSYRSFSSLALRRSLIV